VEVGFLFVFCLLSVVFFFCFFIFVFLVGNVLQQKPINAQRDSQTKKLDHNFVCCGCATTETIGAVVLINLKNVAHPLYIGPHRKFLLTTFILVLGPAIAVSYITWHELPSSWMFTKSFCDATSFFLLCACAVINPGLFYLGGGVETNAMERQNVSIVIMNLLLLPISHSMLVRLQVFLGNGS
jgi:hypothetical protein